MGDYVGALCHLLTRAHLASVAVTRALWAHVGYALDAAAEEVSPQELLEIVLKGSVQHPLSTAIPRDPEHIVQVLRWLEAAWAERGWLIPEALAIGALEDPKGFPELCYKTYIGWGDGYDVKMGQVPKGVTLLESRGGIIHHTTGLNTWGGAALLANWVTDYPQVISGRRVLELGAGVGFTASVILTTSDEEYLPPTAYVATDCHHHVLTLLHHNLELNLKDESMKRKELEAFQEATGKLLVSEEVEAGQMMPWNPPSAQLRLTSRSPDLAVSDDSWRSRTRRGTKVEVLQVDWCRPCRLPEVDVILAADVVYAHHLIPPLVTLIKSILNGSASKINREETKHRKKAKQGDGGGEVEEEEVSSTTESKEELVERKQECNGESWETDSAAEDRVAYIACTRRTHETMGLFMEEVAKQGLVHSLVYQATMDTDTFLFVYDETHLPIKIYKLSLPQQETFQGS